MKKCDILVIGAGPAGYVTAIKSAQLGKNVICVDNNNHLGGTCLNVGCIPSKSLLQSSHHFYKAKNEFKNHGIHCQKLSFSVTEMMQHKDDSLKGLGQGIAGLFKKNKIEHLNGLASFKDKNTVNVQLKDGGKEEINAENVIIATGSNPIHLPNIAIDEKNILTSTGALSLNAVPKKMVVIGAGVIGLEIGSVWARLGADVTIVEFTDNVLNGFDQDVCKETQKSMQKQGLKFMLSSKVTAAKAGKTNVVLEIESKNGTEKMTADKLLVAVGRKANTDKLGLENIGVKTDQHGRIEVDSHYQTAAKNIYAIGDVIAGPMLAHKASDEGIAIAEILSGQAGHVNYDTIPNVVYTHPEIASVGKSENQLKDEAIEYNVGKFPFMANSRGRVIGETEGFVKILACKKTDTVLGVHIVSANAGELIAEAAVAMEFKAASEDLARICNPHPTLNEAVKEAALATFAKPIHF
jgi:dihydrolipoamide dehydrogenase